MRIAVIGLGGVGGYLAAYLSKSSCDIVGFARGGHLRVIQEDGISIIEKDELDNIKRTTTKIDARDLSQLNGFFNIVIFCTKSYDLANVYKRISPFIDSTTILLSLSNGVNNGNLLKKLSNSIVLDACIYILSNIEKNGVIKKHGNVFSIVFGGDENATNTLKSIFKSVSLRVKVPSDIKTAIYKKYIFISTFACLTTYYDESIVQVCESHLLKAKILLKEIADVALASGIEIKDEIEKSLSIAKSLPYNSSTSMHLDYKKGKKTEIESLCGFIVKEGERLLVDTPYMKKIYKKLVQ